MPDQSKPLACFLREHVADVRRIHEQGECGGRPCPFCVFEAQFPGKPTYQSICPECLTPMSVEDVLRRGMHPACRTQWEKRHA